MNTAEQSYIHSLLEPDQVLRGNGHRPAPIRNIVTRMNDWDNYRSAFIAKHGQQAWDELNKPVKVNYTHDNP